MVSGSSGEHGARTSLDDGGAWTDVELCGDEGDVGEVEDLCAVGEGEGPELGRRAQEVDEAAAGPGGHLGAVGDAEEVVLLEVAELCVEVAAGG